LKGAHYYEIPSLFGDDVTYGKKEYIHKSPKFRLSYPKHFNIVESKSDEVFRTKNSFGGVPIMSVSIKDKPQDISLNELCTRFYTPELKKSGADPKMTSNVNTIINDGVQANVIQFDCLAHNRWPLKLSLLSTYHHNELIYVAVQSWAFPDALREYLYSLRFDYILYLHIFQSICIIDLTFPPEISIRNRDKIESVSKVFAIFAARLFNIHFLRNVDFLPCQIS
jgi:hypothetical protein